jgi:hypothetical protein
MIAPVVRPAASALADAPARVKTKAADAARVRAVTGIAKKALAGKSVPPDELLSTLHALR